GHDLSADIPADDGFQADEHPRGPHVEAPRDERVHHSVHPFSVGEQIDGEEDGRDAVADDLGQARADCQRGTEVFPFHESSGARRRRLGARRAGRSWEESDVASSSRNLGRSPTNFIPARQMDGTVTRRTTPKRTTAPTKTTVSARPRRRWRASSQRTSGASVPASISAQAMVTRTGTRRPRSQTTATTSTPRRMLVGEISMRRERESPGGG